MRNSQATQMVAKYGRCPVCDMALWPDGTCTLPLHTAEKEAEPVQKGRKGNGKVGGEVRE